LADCGHSGHFRWQVPWPPHSLAPLGMRVLAVRPCPRGQAEQSEPARSKPLVVKAKDVGSTSAPRQAVSCWPDDYNAPVDWRDKQQVRTKVMEWAAGEQDELRLTEYIESNTLRWIKELEHSPISP